jgi:PAP2 superfamily
MSIDEAGLAPADTLDPSAEQGDEAGFTVHWWREIAYVVGFYLIYTFVRNQFGSASVGIEHAYTNAVRVIDLEKAMGLFHEATIQGWFLGTTWLLKAFNIFYGSFHFVVPAAVLVWLAARHPRDYPTWRNTIMIATGLALIGFSLFPLMPPRLLCDCAYGAGPQAAADGLPTFVDTLAVHGGLWSFGNSTMAAISNQYAAMPSLHFGWALWCALVLAPRVKHRWSKALAIAYPALTLLTIIITGNHYWLDAAGGALVVGVGWFLGSRLATLMVRSHRGGSTVSAR